MNRDDGSALPDKFDRTLGLLDGLTGVHKSKPTTIRVIPPLGVGGSTAFIVQTFRQSAEGDDDNRTPAAFHVFIEAMDAQGVIRLVLPPDVCNLIARQRDTLTEAARLRAARQGALTRKAKAKGAK